MLDKLNIKNISIALIVFFTIVGIATSLSSEERFILILILLGFGGYFFKDKIFTKTAKLPLEEFLKSWDEIKTNIQLYLKQKTSLIEEIKKRNYEIANLHSKLNDLWTDYEKMDLLQEELSRKIHEVRILKEQIKESELKLKQEKEINDQFELSKQKLLEEKKRLSLQLDQLHKIYEKNEWQIHCYQKQIEAISEQQKNYEQILQNTVSIQELEKVEKENERLIQERATQESLLNDLKLQQSNLYQYKIEMEVTQNKNHVEIQQLLNDIEKSQQKIRAFSEVINQQSLTIDEKEKEEEKYRQRIHTLKKEKSQNLKLLKEIQIKLDESLKDRDYYLEEYVKADDRLNQEIINKNEEIAQLREQNNRLNNVFSINQRILEKEYKPRFEQLYQECDFNHLFFRDFVKLTSQERLHAEAQLSALIKNSTNIKTRPHPIPSSSNKNIYELEFKADGKGRIYYRYENGKFNIFRISRNEKHQEEVIAWLQK